MSVCEPTRLAAAPHGAVAGDPAAATCPAAAAPLSVRGVRAFVRSGLRGLAGRAAAPMPLPLPDDALSVVAESDRVWRIDANVALPQPQDRGARFQEQDTLDPDRGLDAALDLAGRAAGPFLCLYQHKEWWMRPAWCDTLAQVPERTQMMLWRDGEAWAALVAVSGDDARADLYGVGGAHGEAADPCDDSADSHGTVDPCGAAGPQGAADLRDTADPHGTANETSTSDVGVGVSPASAGSAASKPETCGAAAHGSPADRTPGLHIALSSNRSGRTALADVAAYMALADTPSDAVRACVEAAAARLGVATVEDRPLPGALSGFGWCTWDSLGRDVSEAAIVEKMEEFRAKGIPVSWVMIDDGWSRTDRDAETLIGFDAGPERFPHGLAHTAALLRERYGVRHVGVWAAFQGYWSGLEPGGPAAGMVADHLTATSNGCLIPAPGHRQAGMFWGTWLSLLRGAGIDCIKIDSQSSTSVMTRGVESYGEATIGRHAALDRMAASEMGGALINCMGMAPEDYWHRPSSAVTRTSDDFLPHDPSSLAEHLMQNAYCSLLMGELYRCDWDMFWSEHPHARTHALMRALSGGPVYCSDAAGRSDPAVLTPLMLADGSVLRPDRAAVPVGDALLADPTRSDRAWCVAAPSGDWTVSAYVGLLADGVQTAEIGAGPDGGWLIDWDERSARLLAAGETFSVKLAYGETRLCYVHEAARRSGRADGVVPIGLIDKYLAPACIEEIRETRDARGAVESVDVTLSESGTFTFLDPDGRCTRVLCDDAPAEVGRRGALCLVGCAGRRVRLMS